MVVFLLGALAGADGWVDRAALAADRLAVAAVDEHAQSRPLNDLWWSGEGQQVLELLDHRACLGRLAHGCLFGAGMPAKAAQAPKRIVQGRKRWVYSSDQHEVLALEVVGTQAVLWVWRERPMRAAALPPVRVAESPLNPTSTSPEPSPHPSPWWLVLLPAAFWIGRYRRSKPSDNQADETSRLEEQLEAERLRFAVERRASKQERDHLLIAVASAQDKPSQREQERIAELEQVLDRIQKRWVHLRDDLDCEAQVSRRDATRFLAPLQQFGAMLRQIERRMRTVDELAYAQKIQQRRLGLQGFEERLRKHFQSSSSFDERSWQTARDELNEILNTAPKSPTETEETNAQLHVLRGGR